MANTEAWSLVPPPRVSCHRPTHLVRLLPARVRRRPRWSCDHCSAGAGTRACRDTGAHRGASAPGKIVEDSGLREDFVRPGTQISPRSRGEMAEPGGTTGIPVASSGLALRGTARQPWQRAQTTHPRHRPGRRTGPGPWPAPSAVTPATHLNLSAPLTHPHPPVKKIVEDPASTETLVPPDCPDLPQKPDLPRKPAVPGRIMPGWPGWIRQGINPASPYPAAAASPGRPRRIPAPQQIRHAPVSHAKSENVRPTRRLTIEATVNL